MYELGFEKLTVKPILIMAQMYKFLCLSQMLISELMGDCDYACKKNEKNEI